MKTPTLEYENREKATNREPVELFHIYDNDTINERYTSGDVAVVYSGHTWKPAPIRRESVSFNSDLSESNLILIVDDLNPTIFYYIAYNPPREVWIKVYKLHRSQSPLEADILFVGTIGKVELVGSSAKVTVKGFESFLNKPVCPEKFQRQCQNQLGDTYCGLNVENWKFTRAVTAVSSDGLILTVASLTADVLALGYVKNITGQWTEYRMIVSNSTTEIKIRYPFGRTVLNQSCDFYYGCSGEITVCAAYDISTNPNGVFDNVNNFRGFPYIPMENPARRISSQSF